MKRFFGWLSFLVVIACLGVGGAVYLLERSFVSEPFGQGTRVVNVPTGATARSLAKMLADAKVVSDERDLYWHLRLFRRGFHPKHGEYEFVGPQKPDDVLGKIAHGDVKLYRFTAAEGLRADEMAKVIGQTGICEAAEFLRIARDPESPKKYGVPGPTLEGYLFPSTYSVPRGAGCGGIVQTMVGHFKQAWAQAQPHRLPEVKLDEQKATTLASIIEKETGQAAERPRISCVFHNRLKKGMRLGTDPTVVYAILVDNDFKWSGNIHKSDLSRPSPYNTYLVKGLPPGPISNPGQLALNAALSPAQCTDYYFVSRNDHTHVFCPDLKCHEANVRKWQIEFFRRRKG